MKIRKVRGRKWFIGSCISRLGSKQEPYYKTEAEMLEDKEYTYESLSPAEKKIYNENKSRSIK
mgnify:CR=1 FL=1